eukprot:gnl/Dysnectes_brevis/2535_a3050_941.p1 GENE.gnl/Dysnectes_brevis/2535_a3050_941~~gnl/Dysnectes_brevis/2535_a3050_941.p1  ORF type:complete len:453 (-),score=190.39 gnl/Dysnectes_brevis/2535_a3050_941:110-1468(-)
MTDTSITVSGVSSEKLNELFQKYIPEDSIDPFIRDYCLCVLGNLDYSTLDSLSAISKTIAPILHSYGLSGSLHQAEEFASTLWSDIKETAGATKRKSTRLSSVVNISSIARKRDQERLRWQKSEQTQDIEGKRLAFEVFKSQQRQKENLAKRILKGKRTHLSLLDAGARGEEDASVSVAAPQRIVGKDIELDSVTLAFGSNVLLEDCSGRFVYGRRYGLVGRNGIGKSSLLKAIDGRHVSVPQNLDVLYVRQETPSGPERVIDVVMGSDEGLRRLREAEATLLKLVAGLLQPISGAMNRSQRMRHAVFWQHHSEQLELDKTCIQTMADWFPGESPLEYRKHLGSFGLTGPSQLQPIRSLSGGQKSRLNFALLTFRNKPHLLLMDEPTNHLDMDTRSALATALNLYQGALLLVSHDAQLVSACCDELWVVEEGRVAKFPGSFQDYREKLRAEK